MPDSLPSSVKNQIENTFETSPYDPDSAKVGRSKICIITSSNSTISETGSISLVTIDIPRIDLISILPEDCMEKMVRKQKISIT